jgi:hypothetical protein
MSLTSEARASRSFMAARAILQAGLFVVVLLPGIDEVQYFFTDHFFITDWTSYLAPAFTKIAGLDKDTIMLMVGAVQIVVALLIAAWPRVGGFAATIGLWLLVANLMMTGAYDIVIRDFGLSMASLATGVAAAGFANRPGGRTGDSTGATTAASTSFATGVERRTTEDVVPGAGAGAPTR